MADVKKTATREGYGQALAELGAEFDNIVVLDADLAGSTKTGVFHKGDILALDSFHDNGRGLTLDGL